MQRKSVTIKINKYVIIGMLFLFSIMIYRVISVSINDVVDGTNIRQFASNRNTVERTLPASRGSIYDVNGSVLAQNSNAYTVVAYLSDVKTTNPEKPHHVIDKDKTAEALAPIINMSKESILKLLNTKNVVQVELGPGGRDISELIKEQIDELELPGITFIKGTKRYYKMGNFASYIIGYAKKNKHDKIVGELGIEASFDKDLRGKDGYTIYQRDAYGYKIANTPEYTTDPIPGKDIYLTIDKNIQILVDNALNELENKTDFTWATFTIADAKTGAIVATSASPSFDLNKRNLDSYLDPLTQYNFEPGSTMKIYSYMANMESGLYNGDELFKSGSITVGDYDVSDFNAGVGFGEISFDTGFVYSSNVAATKLAQAVGRKKLTEFYNNAGFGNKTGIELLDESPGKVNMRYDIDLAAASFGQGITTTPIQNIQALTMLANNGTLIKPYLVDKIVDSSTGEVVVQNGRTEVKKVVSEKTVSKMLNLMYDVVYNGFSSGGNFKAENVTLIGKTSTAQIPNPKGGYLRGNTNYIRGFAGLFPYENPRYIVYIAVKQLKGNVSLMADAVKSVVEEIANYKNITEKDNSLDKSKIITLDSYVNKQQEEIKNQLISQDLIPVVIGDGDIIIDQYPTKNSIVTIDNKIFIKTNSKNYTMPDISNWSRADVISLCNFINLECNFDGYGYVYEFSIPVTEAITDKSTLNIKLNKKEINE